MMKATVYFALLLLCILETSGQKQSKLIRKVCDSCQNCLKIDIIGVDVDGDPLWDCEDNCSNCELPACNVSNGRKPPPECRFCKRGIVECARKCKLGCGICFRTDQKTCNIPRTSYRNPQNIFFPPPS